MNDSARKLDRGKAVEPGFPLFFEDPTDFLEVITPARVRLLREISTEPVILSALALVHAYRTGCGRLIGLIGRNG
jgi:hypothetical protein